MSRKNKNLAGFDDVASEDSTQPNINVNDNDNIKGENHDNKHDVMEQVLIEKKSKVKTHVLKGIYFEIEVANTIDRMARGKGKGIKSELVNEAVKKVFKEKGWM